MYAYVNKVDLANNSDQKEVMLSFKQIYPIFKDEIDGDGQAKVSVSPAAEEVVNLIMSEDFAKNLKGLLNDMLK